MEQQSLDIILPCFNPLNAWEDRIIESCQKLSEQLTTTSFNILLVNDGSSKGISEDKILKLKAAIPNFRIISYSRNRGKGYALRTGVIRSKSQYCIFTDVDFPYFEKDLVAIYNQLLQGHSDIVVGVRDDESYYLNVPKARVKISKFLKFFSRNLFRLPIKDTQCGLKGFNTKGKEVFLRTSIKRYLFDLEFIFLAAREKNIKVLGQPVQLKPGITFSKMNIKILSREGMSFINILVRYYFRVK